MGSFYGQNLRVTIFGQSHSGAIGGVIDGFPAGLEIDTEKLKKLMRRRAPGQNSLSTPRKEDDEVEFVSGLAGGVTCGAPICVLIKNTDARPADYSPFRDTPRPGHADYSGLVKFGEHNDFSGGGHFSGRLTSPLVACGGVCLQLLEKNGINIGAHIEQVHGIADTRFDMVNLEPDLLRSLAEKNFPIIDETAGEKMAAAIEMARENSDSVGGVVECGVTGLPAGLGDPMFYGIENRLSWILFGIPAVKGVEFGNGFEAARLFGTQNNDPFIFDGGRVKTSSNNHGGVIGGITTGMPLVFRVAFKPTPSVASTQKTVSLKEKVEVDLAIRGRHDPCVVPRALPCVEAAAAIALADAFLAPKSHI
ncbi:MAG: chorismate synthase [Eubacteriales bacterium]